MDITKPPQVAINKELEDILRSKKNFVEIFKQLVTHYNFYQAALASSSCKINFYRK